jgi:hypothetical protein
MTLHPINQSFSFTFGVLRPVAETGYSSRTAFEVPAGPNRNTLRKIFLEIYYIYLGNKEVFCIIRHAAYSRFIFRKMPFMSKFYLFLFKW